MLDATYNRDFGYDDLNRLTTANSGSSLWGPGSYRYDAMGNLLARDLGGTVEVDPNDPLIRRGPLTAHPDALPAPGSVHETYGYAGTTAQLTTVTSGGIDHSIAYDASGNEMHYFDMRTYSPRNLMSALAEPSEDGLSHTISYSYDGRGIRLARSEGTTGYATPFANRYYVYSPELQLLAVTVDDNPNVWGKKAIPNVVPTMQHQFGWFNGRPVLDLVGGTTLLYTFDDHLGTPLLQTDANGSVVWRVEYEPYGDVWTMRTGAARDQILRFPGQEYAGKWEGAEERYNIHRWYRSGWGRYTQPDPIGLAGGAGLYQYVQGNPVALVDSLGLFCTKDFIRHYYFGGGKTIDLAAVGLLDAYVNTVSVQGAMSSERIAALRFAEEEAKSMCKGCRGIKSKSFILPENHPYVNVWQDAPCMFSMGSTILTVNTKCSVTADCDGKNFKYGCTSKWKLRDRFTDPLSFRENYGKGRELFGSPYDIVGDWEEYFAGGGAFR